MKKSCLLFLMAAVVLAVAGCSTEVVSETATEQTTEAETGSIAITVEPKHPIEEGEATTIVAKASNGAEVTFVSSDESIATVESFGKITGVATGYAIITAKADGCDPVRVTVAVVTHPDVAEETTEGDEEATTEAPSEVADAGSTGNGSGSGGNTSNGGGNASGTSSTTAAPAPATTEAPATEAPANQGYFMTDGQAIVDLINNGCMQELAGRPQPDGSVSVAGSVYWDSSVAAIAQQRAMEASTNFSHTSASGCRPSTYGENLAMGCGDVYTAYSIWYNSPGHKNTLMISGGCGYACYVAPDGNTYSAYIIRPE